MNEEMKAAWLEISQMLGEPTREELDVFLRTWQRASQATREALAEQPARPYRLLQDNGSKYFGESWDKAEQPAPAQQCMDHGECFGGKCIYPAPQPAQGEKK